MAQEEMIEIDLDGNVVTVPRDGVSVLAAMAAARAGVSERHRDLSLSLGRALQLGRTSLGQPEMRALSAVLEENHFGRFGPAAGELLRAVARELALPEQGRAGRGANARR